MAHHLTVGESAAMLSLSIGQNPNFLTHWQDHGGEVELSREVAQLAILSAELYESVLEIAPECESGVYLYEVDAELGKYFVDQVEKKTYSRDKCRIELGRLGKEYFGQGSIDHSRLQLVINKVTGYSETVH